jgi:2',3'-cyclic-nucleotide 2'-phosphodiesterase
MRILFFGDVVAKLGRRALAQTIPDLKKKYSPDIVIANVENLAHGKGITEITLEELLQAGVNFCTSGNHIWDKAEGHLIVADDKRPVQRPANYPPDVPGRGVDLVAVGDKKLLVVNLIGRVFMHPQFDDPFRAIDNILAEYQDPKPDAVFIDFHAETTSEKVALGLYVAGRVSAVVGTHTHIPTADAEILPGGTAFITDVGMVGGQYTSLGVVASGPIRGFLTSQPQSWEYPESGNCWVNGVVIDIDDQGRATKIEHLRQLVEVAPE